MNTPFASSGACHSASWLIDDQVAILAIRWLLVHISQKKLFSNSYVKEFALIRLFFEVRTESGVTQDAVRKRLRWTQNGARTDSGTTLLGVLCTSAPPFLIEWIVNSG
jgi:hypothetical protein